MKYRKVKKIRKISQTRILILCEGKTEKLYLQGLQNTLPRKSRYDIDLKIAQAKHSEPINALEEMKEKIMKAKHEKQPYSETWLVFDDDNRDLRNFFIKLDTTGIKYVYNSISIEFWFLLHYKETTRQFTNSATIINELQKYHGTYSKTDTKLWYKLKSNYNVAKERAIKLRTKHSIDGKLIPLSKPYSYMDELVEELNKHLN